MADAFWGREKEITDLVVDFQSVKNGQTRFVTIIGDTGIGKTRMVQEFYLSLCMKYDPSEYWPKNIGDTRHTMSIVPNFSKLDENRVHQMPWMWIGLRCQNSNERNSSTQLDSALNRSRQQIAIHLSGIFESRARKKQNAKIGKALITVLDFAFPGINFTTEIIKTILDYVSNGISLTDSVNDIKNALLKKKGSNDRCERVLVQEKRSLVNQTMDVFAALFSLKEKSLPTIPLILVLDDAQWLDPITAEFLNRVLERGIKERWPLMVIATCWENSYKEQAANKGISELSLPHICSGFESRGICRYVYLSKLLDKDISAIIQSELPHIGVEAQNILVEKCSGDLELLWEYIAKLKLTPGWISSDGTLKVSLSKVRGLSSKKKELAIERILDLGNGSIGQLLTCGSAQGTQFDKLFIERCKQIISSVEYNPEDLRLADNPYNLTRNMDRPIIGEIAEFRRFLYYEIAREFFEESPEKDQIQEVLMDFYQEMIKTHIIDKMERNEQIRLYEEYLFLVDGSNQINEETRNSVNIARIYLMQCYLQDGLFGNCIRLGETIIKDETQSHEDLYHILCMLIEASFGMGNTIQEEEYLELFSKLTSESGNSEPLTLIYQSQYLQRSGDATKAVELAEKACRLVKQGTEALAFRCFSHRIVAHFYAGNNIKGKQYMEETEKKFSGFLSSNAASKALIDHSAGLILHNLDLNKQVVTRNINNIKYYQETADHYNYLLSKVNLSDALMGSGKLIEAKIEAESAYTEACLGNWKHAWNIAAICYANVLACQKQASKALIYYEEGIGISKAIGHQWDTLYGQLWYCLALTDMGDPYSALKKLEQIKLKCSENKFDYLESVSATFLLITATKLEVVPWHREEAEELLKLTEKNETPGLTAQAAAAMLLLFPNLEQENCEVADIMINSCLNCEGIKGRPEIIYLAIERNPWVKKHKNSTDMDRWIDTYIQPILSYYDDDESSFQEHFPSSPKLAPCSFPQCEAYCCYDGVYLEPGEEEMLVEFINKYPELFLDIPKEYIVNGNWMDLVTGRKTATRLYHYEKENYPSHFHHTRCVMADERGFCSLQKAAIQLDLHPWHAKPIACCAFPLGIMAGRPVPPPVQGEPDPDYVDESYPGYVTFLPCGKDVENGIMWHKVLRQECIYIEMREEKDHK